MMGPKHDGEEQNNTADIFDPSVDILVGLVAIILLATILILPFVDFSTKRATALQAVNETIRSKQNFRHEGKMVIKLIAHKSGLTFFENTQMRETPLDDVLTDERLLARLTQAYKSKAHPLLFVENEGQEAAFLIETMLAKEGFETISRVYLDPSCSFLKDARRPAACKLGGR